MRQRPDIPASVLCCFPVLERAGKLGTDLHAPLGRDRKSRRERPGALRLGRIVASLCLIAIGGFSLYTAMRGDGLEKQKVTPATDQAATAPTTPPKQDQSAATPPSDG